MFHSRFNYLMSVTGLKNTEIANCLYIDRSLVSRWRTGKREPGKKTVEQISEAVYSLCSDTNDRLLLCQLLQLNYSNSYFQNDGKMMKYILAKWLSPDKEAEEPMKLDWGGGTAEDVIRPEPMNLYNGADGYRYCVKNLLNLALQAKSGFTLYFFGNDNLEWLVRDENFFSCFCSLLRQAGNVGMKARLIFHVSNDSKKMDDYVKLWSWFQSIPGTELYGLYGLANRENNRRQFNNILFAVPEVGVVVGWSVKASSHRYVSMITDIKNTTQVVDDMELLLSGSIPLLHTLLDKVHPPDRTCARVGTEFAAMDFQYEALLNFVETDMFAGCSREFISHSMSLPLGTMPAEVLEEMICDAGGEEREIELLLAVHRRYQDWLETYVRQGTMEYYYFDTGKRKRPLARSEVLFGRTLYYRRDQYQRHLNSTLTYMEQHDNFYLYRIEGDPIYPIDFEAAYGAYLIGYNSGPSCYAAVCTNQLFANCVFTSINDSAKLLPENSTN